MLDQQTIEAEVGIAGTVSDDVLKIAVPRGDLRVTVDGFEIIPFMGLTSWVAFRKGTQQTTVMGDIVLLEDEVGVAVSSAIEAGLYVTALHNHFIRSQPFVLFMHVEATSDEATLGRAVRKIVDSIKAVRLAHPVAPAVKQVPSRLDTAQLEEIIEAKGELKDGVFKFTLGRPDVPVKCSRCGGLEINTTMGYNTWASFQGTQERAAVCGDFAMLELEVVPVIRQLRAGDIEVVAVHNHMFFEEPRIIFLHYWGVGNAGHLANVFRRALEAQKQVQSGETCCSP
ncbi:MAG: DUF1259 domain-containing protein [Methyloceanibacter sp.]|jgi:Domain of Unknown Function (DUF1259)|nr:DUF1259 domain-containing protein [Methyloceanibacter sp.]